LNDPTPTLNLDRLNPRQREAVLHTDGPLLVLAGAGSGKTSTMAYRIAHLIAERGVDGSAILGLSFTRKAAHELRERVRALVTRVSGPRALRGLTITTFHSLCVRILRLYAERIGFSADFTILDRNDQTDVVRQILRHIKVDDRKFDPDTLLFEIGQAKNRFLGPEAAREFLLASGRLPQDYAVVAVSAYERYQDQLQALNAMDFDDLLFHAVRLLEADPGSRAELNERFRHILVDEYQDTNPAQSRLLRSLTEKTQNICVVGDDDQSIYSWRGADPTHILQFARHYAGARTVTLDQNYRSTSTILDAANHVISRNSVRHPKKLWSERGLGEPISHTILGLDQEEAEFVGDTILSLARRPIEGRFEQVRPWKDFAILYRSNTQSRLFEEALRLRQIPYRIVGGMSFLDRKEVKDVLSFGRLVVNPKDDPSARRVINWPPRGIGKASIEALAAHALTQGQSLYEALPEAPRLAPRAADQALAFHTLIAELRAELLATPPEPAELAAWARRSLERIGVKKAIEEENEDDPAAAQRKWDNAEELANAIGQLNVREVLAEAGLGATPAAAAEAMSRGAGSSRARAASSRWGEGDSDEPTLAELAASLEPGGSTPYEQHAVASDSQDSASQLLAQKRPSESASPDDSFSTSEIEESGLPPLAEPEPTGGASPSLVLLREYLARMTLNATDEPGKEDEPADQAVLMTLHGAKGLEFPVVFLVGMEEGLLPHKRTIEEALDFSEERRLCYVGITRAKDQLYLTRCRERMRYGKRVPRNPSRFLEEIPAELLLTRNESGGPDLSSPEAVEKHETQVKDFLAAIRAQIGGGQKRPG
jgi:DNA helicase-2/ATP-dependent DNA helicase PcrA